MNYFILKLRNFFNVFENVGTKCSCYQENRIYYNWNFHHFSNDTAADKFGYKKASKTRICYQFWSHAYIVSWRDGIHNEIRDTTCFIHAPNDALERQMMKQRTKKTRQKGFLSISYVKSNKFKYINNLFKAI